MNTFVSPQNCDPIVCASLVVSYNTHYLTRRTHENQVLEIPNVHIERKIFVIFRFSEFGYLIHLKSNNNCISSLLTLAVTTKATPTNSDWDEKNFRKKILLNELKQCEVA